MVSIWPRYLKHRVLLVLTLLVGVHLIASAAIGVFAILPSFKSLEYQDSVTVYG